MSEAQARYEKRIQDKKEVTGKISDTCRFVGFGLLAIYYTLMSGENKFALGLRDTVHTYWMLQAIGTAGALAILFDYLQYYCGSRSVEEALQREDHKYDDTSWAYMARGWFYKFKQFAVFAGSLILVILVLVGTVGKPTAPKSASLCTFVACGSSFANV